jgi:hypothetical protein
VVTTVGGVPSPQPQVYVDGCPPGKGSVVEAVQVFDVSWMTNVGPVTLAVGPVLAKAPSPFGVPTPVGPS